MARFVDQDTIDHRMRIWKELARKGERVAVIAAQLRMTRAALDQLVYRQRKAGHPDAVYHADACFTNPNPTKHQLNKRLQARRRQTRNGQRSARYAKTSAN